MFPGRENEKELQNHHKNYMTSSCNERIRFSTVRQTVPPLQPDKTLSSDGRATYLLTVYNMTFMLSLQRKSPGSRTRTIAHRIRLPHLPADVRDRSPVTLVYSRKHEQERHLSTHDELLRHLQYDRFSLLQIVKAVYNYTTKKEGITPLQYYLFCIYL